MATQWGAGGAQPSFGFGRSGATPGGWQGDFGGGTGGGATATPAPSPSPISGYAPQGYQNFGGVPFIDPAMINPTDLGSFLSTLTPSVQASMAPMFKQQSQALDESLAGRGIYNSGAAADLQGNLSAQQGADVLGAAIPVAAGEVGSNQQAANAANAYNATAYGNAVDQNMGQYNNFLNTLLGTYLGSFNPPTGLLGQGMGAAGGAYSNAYGASQQGTGGLIGSLASLAPYFLTGGAV